MIRPSILALSISQIYGTCIPRRVCPLFWVGCPQCSNPAKPRLSACDICFGSKRLAVFA